MSSMPPSHPEGDSSPNDVPSPAPRSPSASPLVLIVGGIGCLIVSVVVIALVIALLYRSISIPHAARDRMISKSNMKNISLAMLNHEVSRGSFLPRAILDENGQPLLSWRVAILPEIEEVMLYEEFHLDEPWDSPHNRPLADRMPQVYLCPGVDNSADRTLTHYQVPVGNGTPFEGKQALEFRDFSDGTSNTILIVEVDEGVIWTKPDDWAYDPSNPTEGVGNIRPGGFIAAFADGAVHLLSNNTDPNILRALFTHQGGEEVDPDSF